MRAFIAFSMLVAVAVAAPDSYGRSEVRIETPMRSQYSAPAVVKSNYEAPVAKSGGYESSYGGQELKKPVVPIVSYSHTDDNAGSFKLDFKTGDSIVQSESGSLKDLGGKEGPAQVKTGSYSYTAPDGKTYSVNWKSDEQGFQASGEHLPTPHPIPEEIRKSLEQNRLEEEKLAREGKISSEHRDAYESAPMVKSAYSSPSYAAPAAVRSLY